MKKSTAVLFTLIGIVSSMLIGCSSGDTFTEKSYTIGENEIETVTIQVEDRALEIGTSEDRQIHLDYFDGEKESLDITVSESKDLTIR